MISKNLYDALCQWRDEANSETPSYAVQINGLCDYMDCHCAGDAFDHLQNHLSEDFGPDEYPFDRDKFAYTSDYRKHMNPKRRAWVEAKIATYIRSKAIAWQDYVKAKHLFDYADRHPDKAGRPFYKARNEKIIAKLDAEFPDFKDLYEREHSS